MEITLNVNVVEKNEDGQRLLDEQGVIWTIVDHDRANVEARVYDRIVGGKYREGMGYIEINTWTDAKRYMA